MKLKLLAFAFILAFAISTFGALGASGALAGPNLEIIAAGITVEGPDAACDGALTGFSAVTGAGVEIDNIEVSGIPC